MRLSEPGRASAPVGRELGAPLLRLVRSPTPQRPWLEWQTARYPVTLIRTGDAAVLSLEKRPQAVLALGAGLQWFVTLVALRKESGFSGPWSRTAVGVNVLGLATLLTRGWRGGYLGWALPESYHHTFLRGASIRRLPSPDPQPASRVPVTLSASGQHVEVTSDAGGRVRLDLVADLGLVTAGDDRPVLLSTRTGGTSEEIFSVRPSQFLYTRYAFVPGTPVYASPRSAGPPVATIAPDGFCVVLGRAGPGYLVSLGAGAAGYVEPPAAPVPAGFSALAADATAGTCFEPASSHHVEETTAGSRGGSTGAAANPRDLHLMP